MPKHFTSGQIVPASGIYSVHHAEHRLPHEVTLLEGQHFPACSRCGTSVTFQSLRPVHALTDRREQILLHTLPEIGEPELATAAGAVTPASDEPLDVTKRLDGKKNHKPRAKAHRKGRA